MSQFNLMPNPTIVGIQFCIFMFVLVLIKNLFIKPYKLLREKRQALTIGTKQEGERLFAENQSILNSIESSLKEGQEKAKSIYQEISSTSKTEAEKIVQDSEKNMQKELQELQAQIRSDVSSIGEEIKVASNKISKEVYSKIYNG